MSDSRRRAVLGRVGLALAVGVTLALTVNVLYGSVWMLVYVLGMLIRLHSETAMIALAVALHALAGLAVVAVLFGAGRALRNDGRRTGVIVDGAAFYLAGSLAASLAPRQMVEWTEPLAMIHVPVAAFLVVAALVIQAVLSGPPGRDGVRVATRDTSGVAMPRWRP